MQCRIVDSFVPDWTDARINGDVMAKTDAPPPGATWMMTRPSARRFHPYERPSRREEQLVWSVQKRVDTCRPTTSNSTNRWGGKCFGDELREAGLSHGAINHDVSVFKLQDFLYASTVCARHARADGGPGLVGCGLAQARRCPGSLSIRGWIRKFRQNYERDQPTALAVLGPLGDPADAWRSRAGLTPSLQRACWGCSRSPTVKRTFAFEVAFGDLSAD